MTIVGHFLPDHHSSQWDYLWPSWSANPYSHSHGDSFDRWREPFRPITRPTQRSDGAIQIPIQIIGRHNAKEAVSDSAEEWSDSDYDDLDLNNSSSRMRRKKHRSQYPVKTISSNDSLLNAAINIDDEEEELKRKGQKSHDKLREPTVSTRRVYNTRSVGVVEENKPLLIRSDSEEKDFNDTNGYSVYSYLKAFLSSSGRQIDGIKGDGNCFFRALSKIIYGNQNYYDEVRQAVVEVMEKYPKKFEAFADGPISHHIENMREDKTWATQTEIYAAATLLNRDIYILSPDQTGDKYRWLLFQPQFKYNATFTGCRCYITICHTHGNHYDRIAPISGKCNCSLDPPQMTGVKGEVDLTSEDEIV